MIKLIISCLNVSFKKLIVWLQLHPKRIASDYITTGRPLGRTKGVHSCVTPQGALSGGCEAWLANPSSLTYFNTNGRVSGLGETSWYVMCALYQRPDGNERHKYLTICACTVTALHISTGLLKTTYLVLNYAKYHSLCSIIMSWNSLRYTT